MTWLCSSNTPFVMTCRSDACLYHIIHCPSVTDSSSLGSYGRCLCLVLKMARGFARENVNLRHRDVWCCKLARPTGPHTYEPKPYTRCKTITNSHTVLWSRGNRAQTHRMGKRDLQFISTTQKNTQGDKMAANLARMQRMRCVQTRHACMRIRL